MIKKYVPFLTLLLLVSTGLLADKVLIFTYSYNRPDFIEIQYHTFNKFLKDDYEFVVFNDSPDTAMAKRIELTCKNLNIRCIPIPQEIHALPYLSRQPGDDYNHPSIRNCNVVQYSLNKLGFLHDGIVALFDSDLFLVKDFSISEYMKDYQLAGLRQSRARDDGSLIEYLWIGIVFLDMSKMPNKTTLNFNTGRIDNIRVDAGGFTYFYLDANPKVSIGSFSYAIAPFLCPKCEQNGKLYCTHNTDELKANGFDKNQIKFVQSGPLNCEFFERASFVHYRAGSNWDHQTEDYHKKKTKLFNEYIENILK